MPRKRKDSIAKTALADCQGCGGICCHDLSIIIPRPRTRHDIDTLKWQLNYDTVGVYIRSRRWHLIVKGRCMFLDEKDLCTRYEERFDICRNHMPPLCERYDEWYDVMFTHPDELEAYLRAQRRGETPPLPTSRWKSKGAGPTAQMCKSKTVQPGITLKGKAKGRKK